MELIFKYNQTSFIRAQQIDRAIYNGLCFIMCIDYLYNKEKIFLVTMIIFQTYVILHLDIVLCCTIIKEEGLVKIHI